MFRVVPSLDFYPPFPTPLFFATDRFCWYNGQSLLCIVFLSNLHGLPLIRHLCLGVKGAVIGVDLGTTNSCVAVMEGKAAKVGVLTEQITYLLEYN
jgi:hypothetical protein